jgi:hypothetical protein
MQKNRSGHSGGKSRLSGPELSRALGVTENRRADWARRGLVTHRARNATYGPTEAVELALVNAVFAAAGAKRGKGAWERLRVQMGPMDGTTEAWAVIDLGLHGHRVLPTPADAARAATNLGRPIRILALHEIAAVARERYAEAASAKPRRDSRPVRRSTTTIRRLDSSA